MKKLIPVMAAMTAFLSGPALWAQDLPELKVVKVEIVPNSAKDVNDPFFRRRPILEVAPASKEDDARLQLPTYRSYRFIVTIQVGPGKEPGALLVSTQSVRDGKTMTLGKTRVALEGPSTRYACYDVFPAEAGPGECVIRTIVKADHEGKVLEFKAAIVR